MIRRTLYQIAGIDRATLATCPATDKMWATHLGLSLLLSFTVVFGISLHAIGYVISDPWMRLPVAVVVALTVFMFDRALYQSDWFFQGLPWQSGGEGQGRDGWATSRRLLRITIRLAMSFGLAWVIAVFLELAIFSDTISDKIKRDHVAVNQPVYANIEQYQALLTVEIEERRKNLATLEELYRRDLTADPAPVAQADEDERQIRTFEDQIAALDRQQQDLRRELRQVEEKIAGYAQEMNAEKLGQRINPNNSGRAGAGPRFQFARSQKEVFEERRSALQDEIASLRSTREDLRAQQRRLAEEGAARRGGDWAALQKKRDALHARMEAARAEFKELQESRLAKIEAFRRAALASSEFQKQKDDPLSRMTAYQALKNDPKDGGTIILFSWMTKFLVIFLEIVPVVAKMFFSPPSVYAAKVQAEVERERASAQLVSEASVVAADQETKSPVRPEPAQPEASAYDNAANAELRVFAQELDARVSGDDKADADVPALARIEAWQVRAFDVVAPAVIAAAVVVALVALVSD
jgi:hypothetical protein